MKIYNLSYNNPPLLAEVHAITGKPYGFFRSIFMKGTGSPPLTVKDGPSEMMKILNQNRDKKYCNIEILTDGIIFRFKSRLENYGIPINRAALNLIEFTNAYKAEGQDYAEVIEIKFENDQSIILQFKTHEKHGLIKFFEKGFFQGIFLNP